MSNFKSIQTGVFRRLVAVSWKLVPSVRPYHSSCERRHTYRHLPDFIRICETQTIMSDRCVHLSFCGQSCNGMLSQLPYIESVESFPTWQLSRNDSVFVRAFVFKDEYFMKKCIERSTRRRTATVALRVLHVPAHLQASNLWWLTSGVSFLAKVVFRWIAVNSV
jgi:hypothetical protein